MMQKGPNMTNFRRTMIVQAEEECNAEKGIQSWNAGQPLEKAEGNPFFFFSERASQSPGRRG